MASNQQIDAAMEVAMRESRWSINKIDTVRRMLEAAESVAPVENDELRRLREIEAAATAWRRSLECDDWTIHAIEQDVCRPGMSALLRLIPATEPQCSG